MNRYIDADALMERIQKLKVVTDDMFGMGIARGIERAETAIEMQLMTDVVEVKPGGILLPLTEEELRFLRNDAIAYIWRMENDGRNKEEFGYFSRKELLRKLDWFLKTFETPVCQKE